ncbi:hypothetical protein H6P81_014463 [Aristolochia fimbriata]|uniref:AIPP2-like SPOC-like domain-containing protein n=1 Tax=Aristolochia fimbriata TaxID=158543 RepID=A0AAV7EHL9_ARIFI|nr:hypothetical protein H6P81_014463 [Aristolochia fimbriata]
MIRKAIRVEILLKSKIEKSREALRSRQVGLQAKDCSELGESLADRMFRFKAEEHTVRTRKCEPDASAKIVKSCERQADQYEIENNLLPQYRVEGRFERINEHPTIFVDAETHSFSIGITVALNMNLLIELRADDIEYVYRDGGGLKLEETARRSFEVYPTTNQAAKYECTAILKDSNFNKIDRATCQFVTTATVLVNGTEVVLDTGTRKDGMNGFFDAIRGIWKTIWGYFVDFFTGKSCRGSFEVHGTLFEGNIYHGIEAYHSNSIGHKALEALGRMPTRLIAVLLPRFEVWPRIFQKQFLDDDDVALYFLPSDCESSKERYIHFLKMIDTSDLAIRCHFKGQTLVPYLWGVLCHPSTSIPASRNGNPRQR